MLKIFFLYSPYTKFPSAIVHVITCLCLTNAIDYFLYKEQFIDNAENVVKAVTASFEKHTSYN